MSTYTQCIQTLIDALGELPGIGPRTAERLAFHILKEKPASALRLADAIRDVKLRVRHCTVCYNLAEGEQCPICADAGRDQSVVCVVEQPKDLLALESAGLYRGVYHVLLGRISPSEGVRPEDLTLGALLERIKAGSIREVILGTNPNVEGDGTALYIQQQLAPFGQVQVSRLARGLPTGGNIEYANKNMLADALLGRQKV
jgi:recombination protein RecR